MPKSPLTVQFKEKPTFRVRCLYSSFVHGERGRGYAEPVFLNVYRAQESIPRNEFRQPI